MLAFFLSPLGRRISAALIIVAVLFAAVKNIQHNAYERGKSDGQQNAWTQMEKQNEARWAEIRKELNTREAKAAEKVVEVEKAHTALKQEKEMHRDPVKQHEASFEPFYRELAPRLEAVLPDAAQPIKEQLALKDLEISSLKENVTYFVRLADRYDELITETNLANNETIATKNARIEQLTVERDFFKSAFHESTPKKRGFWHKVKRIVTLGVAK